MNKGLIEYKENIFSKIRRFILKIFKKKENAPSSKRDTMTLEQYEEEKREILELYKKIKENQIDIMEISQDKALKINELYKAEIKIKNKRLEQITTERKISEYNTNKYRDEIEKYKKMLEKHVS